MSQTTRMQELKYKVDAIDLEPIKFKLMCEDGWTQQQADEVEPLYKGYLLLIGLNPNQSLVPTKVIDKMWHAHILDTAKYHDDCQTTFGGYIHHFPYLGLRGPDDEKKLVDMFDATKSVFLSVLNIDISKPVACFNSISNLNEATTCEGPNGCSGNTCGSDFKIAASIDAVQATTCEGPNGCSGNTCGSDVSNSSKYYARPTRSDVLNYAKLARN